MNPSHGRAAARWSLGGISAEADPLLDDAFVDNGVYSRLVSPGDPQWFLVGRTGSGKSAALRELEREMPNKVARLEPRQLAFQHITNLQAVRRLLAMNVRLEPFFHALWHHLILCQVLRHRHTNATEEVKRRIFDRLREAIRKTPTQHPLNLAYIDQLESDFWNMAEDQVHRQVDTLAAHVDDALKGEMKTPVGGLSASTGGGESRTREVQAEWRDRFQRIVNDQVVTHLNATVRALADTALGSSQHFTYVLIDDLDLTWVEDDVANLLIKSLLQVALDLQRTRYVKVVVALRTNIFDQLGVGNQRRGGQEEKLRGAAMTLTWSPADLETLVNRRLAAAARIRQLTTPPDLAAILPKASRDNIRPFMFILNRTLMRPRDVILYFNRCFEQCPPDKPPRITWNIIKEVEPRYSRDRLSALRDEWNDPFYDIERVLDCFQGRPWAFGLNTLAEVCENIALLLVDADGDPPTHGRPGVSAFRGAPWLTPLCEPLWQPASASLPWRDRYGPLLGMLFDIGFLGFAARTRYDAVYGTDPTADLRDLLRQAGDQEPEFTVHPAFRQALQMPHPRGRRGA